MARITDGMLPDGRNLRLTLDRYQEIMRLPIAAFNGLNLPEEVPQYQCSYIWTQSERDYLATHISQAEEKREQELGYYLAPVYVDAYYEFDRPLVMDNKYLITLGERSVDEIEMGYVLDHGTSPDDINDPLVITVPIGDVASLDEVVVLYPGEQVEIRPSHIQANDTTITIRIPRSRLVLPELNDNREDPLSYYNNDNFLSTVDVVRRWYNQLEGMKLIWEGWQGCGGGFDESEQIAWWRIRDERVGIVDFGPARQVNGNLRLSRPIYGVMPVWLRIRSVSGRRASMNTEMETARFAHTLMPNKPESCPTVHMYWDEDIQPHPGDIMTPYGNTIGAVRAWLSDSRAKVGSGGMLISRAARRMT
jgi:hypothetical protein